MSIPRRTIRLFLVGLVVVVVGFNSMLILLDHKFPPLVVTTLANQERVNEIVASATGASSDELYDLLISKLAYAPRNSSIGLVNPFSRSRAILRSDTLADHLNRPALLFTTDNVCKKLESLEKLLTGTIIVQATSQGVSTCACLPKG